MVRRFDLFVIGIHSLPLCPWRSSDFGNNWMIIRSHALIIIPGVFTWNGWGECIRYSLQSNRHKSVAATTNRRVPVFVLRRPCPSWCPDFRQQPSPWWRRHRPWGGCAGKSSATASRRCDHFSVPWSDYPDKPACKSRIINIINSHQS